MSTLEEKLRELVPDCYPDNPTAMGIEWALREAARAGAEAQREKVPHLTIMPWFKTTTAEAGDHYPSECARLGGRCAGLVTGSARTAKEGGEK